jgi:hypothetical protein
MFLILAAAAGGLLMSWRSLQTFEEDVMARQRDFRPMPRIAIEEASG